MKLMIRPSESNVKEALQWSHIDKKGKLKHRAIGARKFTEKLYYDMKWPTICTVKCLGTLLTCRDEKAFVFEFNNPEMYSMQSVPDKNNENRRVRKEYIQREMWENWGEDADKYDGGLVRTLEDLPDDYVVFTKFSNPRRTDGAQIQTTETGQAPGQISMAAEVSDVGKEAEDGNIG